jgi:hypothetical protein
MLGSCTHINTPTCVRDAPACLRHCGRERLIIFSPLGIFLRMERHSHSKNCCASGHALDV